MSERPKLVILPELFSRNPESLRFWKSDPWTQRELLQACGMTETIKPFPGLVIKVKGKIANSSCPYPVAISPSDNDGSGVDNVRIARQRREIYVNILQHSAVPPSTIATVAKSSAPSSAVSSPNATPSDAAGRSLPTSPISPVSLSPHLADSATTSPTGGSTIAGTEQPTTEGTAVVKEGFRNVRMIILDPIEVRLDVLNPPSPSHSNPKPVSMPTATSYIDIIVNPAEVKAVLGVSIGDKEGEKENEDEGNVSVRLAEREKRKRELCQSVLAFLAFLYQLDEESIEYALLKVSHGYKSPPSSTAVAQSTAAMAAVAATNGAPIMRKLIVPHRSAFDRLEIIRCEEDRESGIIPRCTNPAFFSKVRRFLDDVFPSLSPAPSPTPSATTSPVTSSLPPTTPQRGKLFRASSSSSAIGSKSGDVFSLTLRSLRLDQYQHEELRVILLPRHEMNILVHQRNLQNILQKYLDVEGKGSLAQGTEAGEGAGAVERAAVAAKIPPIGREISMEFFLLFPQPMFVVSTCILPLPLAIWKEKYPKQKGDREKEGKGERAEGVRVLYVNICHHPMVGKYDYEHLQSGCSVSTPSATPDGTPSGTPSGATSGGGGKKKKKHKHELRDMIIGQCKTNGRGDEVAVDIVMTFDDHEVHLLQCGDDQSAIDQIKEDVSISTRLLIVFTMFNLSVSLSR